MKIAIIGANGQVGKEIATIFTKWGHDVTAIVRNPFGAAFFHLNGIKYVISDIVTSNEADQAVAQADAVVIAAVARGSYQYAVRINESIIQATIKKCHANSCVHFFSSIRVLSRAIDGSRGRLDPLTSYDKEKIHSEKYVETECRQKGIRCRILRLGHVIGYHQAKTEKFLIATRQSQPFLVDKNADSNSVHTLTICDAILETTNNPADVIKATLVNQPQWSWETLFRHINQTDSVSFTQASPSKNRSPLKVMVKGTLQMLRPLRKWIKDYQDLMGEKANDVLYFEKRRPEIISDIQLLHPEPCILSEFAYSSAPGPFLDNLDETSQLIRVW
jgi:nucleoside-diphosphate-sugar epimerase